MKTNLIFLMILLIGIIIYTAFTPYSVVAQTATPPPNVDYIDINGETLALESTVTFGDIAIVIVGMFLGTVMTVFASYKLISDYLK